MKKVEREQILRWQSGDDTMFFRTIKMITLLTFSVLFRCLHGDHGWNTYIEKKKDWFFTAVWGSSLPTYSDVENSWYSWFLSLFYTLSWSWVYPYRYCWRRMRVLHIDSPMNELGLNSVFIYRDEWESIFPFKNILEVWKFPCSGIKPRIFQRFL